MINYVKDILYKKSYQTFIQNDCSEVQFWKEREDMIWLDAFKEWVNHPEYIHSSTTLILYRYWNELHPEVRNEMINIFINDPSASRYLYENIVDLTKEQEDALYNSHMLEDNYEEYQSKMVRESLLKGRGIIK